MAEKGFKVLTVKEKYYKKVRDYYRNILEEIDSVRFTNEARLLQEKMKKNKISNLCIPCILLPFDKLSENLK